MPSRTTPTPDPDLLYETLDAVVAAAALGDTHVTPDDQVAWEQGSWCRAYSDDNLDICGTAACLAGHRLLLDGYRITGYDTMVSPDGEHEVSGGEIAAVAMRRLGLRQWQADRLFAGDNDLNRLKEVVDHIAAGGCGDPDCTNAQCHG